MAQWLDITCASDALVPNFAILSAGFSFFSPIGIRNRVINYIGRVLRYLEVYRFVAKTRFLNDEAPLPKIVGEKNNNTPFFSQ